MVTEKRLDLQCWRAFSILAVLLFHIWPQLFPNGFVGVDIFFIISGYFMAKLYFNQKTFDLQSVGKFYFKRVKRITPVYFITLICLFFLLYYSIADTDFIIALKDFKWAAVFFTNFQDKKTNLDYFRTTSEFHFFRHCWSLSVEMQFYLFFPFIAFIQHKIKHNSFLYFIELPILLGSLVFQLIQQNPIDFYENTISRLWQFMVGIIAAQQSFEHINEYLCKFLFILSSVITFCPIPFLHAFASFIIVITVAVIITFSSTIYSPFNNFPFYSGIVYFGDISYILYLIHWPLITYMKYNSINSMLNIFESILAGLSSITLAIILHETLEKPLIKHCNSFLRLLCFLFFSYLLILCYIPSFLTIQEPNSNITQKFIIDVKNFSKPIQLPLKWTKENDIEFSNYIKQSNVFIGNISNCDIEKHFFVNSTTAYTHYCEVETSLTGNLTAMLIGNSYAHNVLPIISLNQIFKKVTSMTAFGCLFVKSPFEVCIPFVKAVKEAVKNIKPDIIYFIQGYAYLLNQRLKEKSIQEKWRNEFKYAFNFLQQYSTVIITNFQHYRFRIPINAEFLRIKKRGFEINMNERKQPGLTTLDKLQLNASCKKCLWINYNDVFCQNDFCTPIDPFIRLPLFIDRDHLTILGSRRVHHIYENVTEKALMLIKKL